METRIFDFAVIGKTLPDLLEYLDITLFTAFTSIILGSLLGIMLAFAKLSSKKILSYPAHGYTYIIRCTPSIVLLFIVFYGLPQLADSLFKIDMNNLHRAVFAIISFTMLFGGYISEVFRAAYLAVPRGQYESAVCAGLTPLKAFWHILLPQAALIALPNFGNSTISLLKEGALAYTIGLIDLIGRGNLIIAQNFGAFGIEIYLACMLIYWVLTLSLEYLFSKAETYLAKGHSLHKPQAKSQSWLASLKKYFPLHRLHNIQKGGEINGA